MIVSDVKDVEKISLGDQFIIEPSGFDDPEHDPEAFADAHAKLRSEVDAALEEKFTPKEPKEPLVIERMDENTLMVTVNEGLPAVIDGDARKKTIKTNNPTKVGLQKAREGFITVNDEKVEYPDA